MTSFDKNTLAERFQHQEGLIYSHMQIAHSNPADPDATIVLNLYNEHNAQPMYLQKRSVVETVESYKCRLDILEPYDGSGKTWCIDAASLDLAIDRVLFMKVENNHRCRNLNNRAEPHMDEWPMPPRRPHFWKKPGLPARLPLPEKAESSTPLPRPAQPVQVVHSDKPPQPVNLPQPAQSEKLETEPERSETPKTPKTPKKPGKPKKPEPPQASSKLDAMKAKLWVPSRKLRSLSGFDEVKSPSSNYWKKMKDFARELEIERLQQLTRDIKWLGGMQRNWAARSDRAEC